MGAIKFSKVCVSQFLKDNGMLGLPLQPLRGNEFNILFANAGHVYFLRHKKENKLHEWVSEECAEGSGSTILYSWL